MSYGGFINDTPRMVDDYVDLTPDTARGAAVSVGVLLVASALFLTILKRSGFRAMVAVGRS